MIHQRVPTSKELEDLLSGKHEEKPKRIWIPKFLEPLRVKIDKVFERERNYHEACSLMRRQLAGYNCVRIVGGKEKWERLEHGEEIANPEPIFPSLFYGL